MQKKTAIPKKAKIAMVIMVVSFPILFIGIGCIDERAKDFPELELIEAKTIAPKDNAFLTLKQTYALLTKQPAWEKLTTNTEQPFDYENTAVVYHPLHEYDTAYWEKVLKDNEKVLQLIDQACQQKEFSYPVNFDFAETVPVIELLSVSRVLSVRAYHYARTGQWGKNLEDIKKLRKIANFLYQEQQPTLVSYLIGVAIEAAIYPNIEHALHLEQIPDSTIRDYITFLNECKMSDKLEAYRKSLKFEFKFNQEAFKNTNELFPLFGRERDKYFNNPYSFHRNATLNKVGENFLKSIEYSRLPLHEAKIQIEEYEKDLHKFGLHWHDILKPNHGGEALLHSSGNAIMKQITRVYEIRVLSDLVALKAAAKLYQRKHGNLPPTLEPIDEYLGRTPHDPYAGVSHQAYQYDAKKGVIWSFGQDFTNDGGDPDWYHYFPDHHGDRKDKVTLINPHFTMPKPTSTPKNSK